MKNKCIRHGDVIFRPIDKPNGKAEKKKEYTVAYGEVTGHHHTLYPMSAGAFLSLFQDGEKRVIDLKESWSLRHQEHDELIIPPGTYEIGIEREYDPFEKAMKKVVD